MYVADTKFGFDETPSCHDILDPIAKLNIIYIHSRLAHREYIVDSMINV